MKKQKAPGPDDITLELVLAFDEDNRICLLDLINKWWNTKTIDEELEKANIISIFKKGDTSNIANYRPIALLSVFYKIYAALLRARLTRAIDPTFGEHSMVLGQPKAHCSPFT